MKLFYKILIALMLISVIPILVYSIFVVGTTGKTLKNIIDENNVNLSHNVLRAINEYFKSVEDRASFAKGIERNGDMSNHPILKEGMQGDMLSGIVLLNKNLIKEKGWGIDKGSINERIVRKALSSDKYEITDLVNTESGDIYFDAAYPISQKTRECLYIRYSINYLAEKINPYLKSKTARNLFLIDPSGRGVAVSAKNYIRISRNKLKKFDKNNFDEIFVENKNINILQKSILPGWIVLFQEPLKYAYYPVRQIWLISVGLIIITLGFAFLGAFLLAKNLYQPLESLVSGMEKVSEGDLDYHLKIQSNDEVSRLAFIFNSMTDKLKKMQTDMRNRERLSAMGQMANVLGHEIRNPLGAIVNALYIIRHFCSGEKKNIVEINKYVDVIDKEIKSTEKIINNMLDFSRTRPPVKAKSDLSALTDEIMSSFSIPGNVKVEIKKEKVPEINIDREEIKQVIRNVLNNAIESMKEKNAGFLKISLQNDQIEKRGQLRSSVSLTISDTGGGIPPENISKIFEPFFSTKSKGTGLGLAVVLKIVEERHEGKIEVTSRVGEGTEFKIKLPV